MRVVSEGMRIRSPDAEGKTLRYSSLLGGTEPLS